MVYKCTLFSKHVERIRGFCNFNDAFIRGVSGSGLKKDALTKHITTGAHLRAEQLEDGPLLMADLAETAIGEHRRSETI